MKIVKKLTLNIAMFLKEQREKFLMKNPTTFMHIKTTNVKFSTVLIFLPGVFTTFYCSLQAVLTIFVFTG